MEPDEMFAGFNEETQKRYEKEARQQYGDDSVTAATRRWNSYTDTQKSEIMAGGGAIYREIVTVMDQGPASTAVQNLIAQWHQHLRHFYEPTPEILLSLGHLYNESPDFCCPV